MWKTLKIVKKMLRRINPYKTFYLSFASTWLAAVLLNVTLGLFQDPLLVLDSIGVVFLVHDTHPEITKAIDPNDDDDNFFKNDRGIRLLIVLGVAVYSVLIVLLVHGNEVEELGDVGSRSTAIKTVVDVFGFLPSSASFVLVFFLVYSWVVGLYMYLREPEVGGVLHRSLARLQELFEDDYDIRRLRKSLSGEEKRVHVRAGRILLSQLGVGTIISVVVFSISVLVFIVLSTPVVTVAAILLWMGYEAIGSQRKTEFLRSLDEVTEGPQRLLFDFEVIEGGLRGVAVVLYVVLTFFVPILMLSVFVGQLIETVATALSWVPSGEIFTPAGALSVFPFLSFLITGMLLSVYSFIVSYSFLNRLSVWLRETPPAETEEVPDLPKAVSMIYPVSFLFYFGVLSRVISFVSESIGDSDTIAYLLGAVTVAVSPIYIVLVYDAYKRAKAKSVQTLDSTPENDYYRVPLVLSTQIFAFFYIAPFGDYGLSFILYVIFTANLAYLIPRVLRFFGLISSEFLGSILSDTYMTILTVLVFLSANAANPEMLSVPEAAVICGVIGGLLYSSTLIEHVFFRD